jgi:hypothetical protein
MAYLLQNGRVALASPISSGRYGHLTEKGSFKVLEKKRTHYSSMYGKIVDSRGNTIVADADADMPIPPRGKIYSGANALLHAIRRRRRNACRISTRLSSVARLCPYAGTVRDCVFQFSQCWHSGHGVRKDPKRGVTWGNHDRHFQGALIDLGTRASIQHLVRLRHLGGGDKRASLIRL